MLENKTKQFKSHLTNKIIIEILRRLPQHMRVLTHSWKECRNVDLYLTVQVKKKNKELPNLPI